MENPIPVAQSPQLTLSESQRHPRLPTLVGVPLSHDPYSARAIIKRAFDMLAAAAALLSLAPLLALIAMAVKLSSKGPVLFVQTRVGAGGKVFRLYKFRSMVVDAESQIDNIKGLNEASGPVFKIKRDPRVTRVGRFLRKHSLDELPQLFNVLRGDMSVVGPRPPLPSEVKQYQPWQLRRLSVPQGLTCIWQVSGRSDVSFEEWVRLDLKYIDTWSLRQDLRIILQTVLVVLRGSGAY